MTGVSLLPVAPVAVLALVAAAALLLVWWPAGRLERPETRTARVRRSAMVALLVVAALRPALPGGEVQVDPSAVDVYVVVDTTTSVNARDYGSGQPRLDGVKADLRALATQLAGARFTLLTFDQDTRTRLPLTTDAQALVSAAETLTPETSTWSQGSSVTVAADDLEQALTRGQAAHPERARVVFYLGDGEQTADADPAPFRIPDGLVNGGAVLGYGTAAGGAMARTGTREGGDVLDPSTGSAAVSRIDEKELQAIAGQLGVPYLHRTTDDGGAAIMSALRLTHLDALRAPAAGADPVASLPGGRSELSWLALAAVALLAAWELGAALAALGRLGGRGVGRRGVGMRGVGVRRARRAGRSDPDPASQPDPVTPPDPVTRPDPVTPPEPSLTGRSTS